MTRIAIIAPALALRAGLRSLLSDDRRASGDPDANRLGSSYGAGEIVAEAASLAEWAAAGGEADVLLIAAEAFDEAAIRRSLQDGEGRLAALVLSDGQREAQILSTLPLRGWGVLPQDVSAEELKAGLQAAAEGLVVGTMRLFAPALSRLEAESRALSGEEGGYAGSGESLTERESQVLQLLARGLPNKQIALALGISEHTVKFHISSIYSKLGVTNRTEAVRSGVRRGLVLL